jgi:GAF domain-containing protein/HAMP domain-containing protein
MRETNQNHRQYQQNPLMDVLRPRTLRARLLRLLTLLVVVLALAFVATSVVVGFLIGRQQALAQLDSTASLKQAAVERWVQDLQLDMAFEATALPQATDFITLLRSAPDTDSFQNARDAITRRLNNRVSLEKRFDEIFVLDLNGQVVLSTNPLQEKKIFQNELYFREGQKEQFISPPFYDVSLGSQSVVFAQPIVYNGKIFGVLAGRASLQYLSEIIQKRAGLGQTGETYLLDTSFASLTTLLQNNERGAYVRTELARQVIQTGANGSGVYEGYYGQSVIGVAKWLPDLQVVLVAEQSQLEAFASTYTTIAIIVIVTAVMLVLVFFLSVRFARTIGDPISRLADTAKSIEAGDWTATAQVEHIDEVGDLAMAFNSMTRQLRDVFSNLENRVQERTKALSTVSEISTKVSSLLDIEKLLQEVVDLSKERFDLYHAHIYMLDDKGETLVLAAGSGTPGRQMVAEGRAIPLNREQSLVARAARAKQGVTVNDVTEAPDFLPNPLLPDTRSELAVPMILGEQVLGVFDVQSDKIGRFGESDINVQTILASQIAASIQNVRLYEQSRKIAADLAVVSEVGITTSNINDPRQLLQRVVDLAQKSFKLYHAQAYMLNAGKDILELVAGSGELGQRMVATGMKIPVESERSLIARAARTQKGIITNDVDNEPGLLRPPLLPETSSEMSIPMISGDKVVGVLDLQSEKRNYFTATDLDIQTTLASQTAAALQNAHSFARAQKQAERETMLNLATKKIQDTTSMEDALKTTARELGHLLGVKTSVNLAIGTPQAKSPTALTDDPNDA